MEKVNPQPKEWPIHVADPSIAERIDKHFDEMSAALKDADKQARIGKVEELKASIKESDFTEEELLAWGSDIAAALKSLEKHAMRQMVIETGNVLTDVAVPKFVLFISRQDIFPCSWFWLIPAWPNSSIIRLYAWHVKRMATP